MWQHFSKQHLSNLAAKDKMWTDLREEHRCKLVSKDQKYLATKSNCRRIVEELLDKTRQNERALMESINELEEYSKDLEGDARRQCALILTRFVQQLLHDTTAV